MTWIHLGKQNEAEIDIAAGGQVDDGLVHLEEGRGAPGDRGEVGPEQAAQARPFHYRVEQPRTLALLAAHEQL